MGMLNTLTFMVLSLFNSGFRPPQIYVYIYKECFMIFIFSLCLAVLWNVLKSYKIDAGNTFVSLEP